MRRLTASVVLLAMAALAPASCKRRSRARAAPAEESSPPASVVNVADPEAAGQLISGFYGLENDAWRWTMARFSVALRPPESAPTNGAKLELKGELPPAIVNQLGPISLSATVNGHPLESEKFSTSGSFTYSQEVPASALRGASARVDFAVDKALPPGSQDARELALIVTSIGLVPVSPN